MAGWRYLHLGLVEKGKGVPLSPYASTSVSGWIWTLHHGHRLATGDKRGSVRGGTETVSAQSYLPKPLSLIVQKAQDMLIAHDT